LKSILQRVACSIMDGRHFLLFLAWPTLNDPNPTWMNEEFHTHLLPKGQNALSFFAKSNQISLLNRYEKQELYNWSQIGHIRWLTSGSGRFDCRCFAFFDAYTSLDGHSRPCKCSQTAQTPRLKLRRRCCHWWFIGCSRWWWATQQFHNPRMRKNGSAFKICYY